MATIEEVESLFAPIADAVAEFAHKHSFDIEKCPRGNSGWELARAHAQGGTATLLLLYDPSLGLGLGSVWQYPCPEMSLIYYHFRDMRPCRIAAADVVTRLREEMNAIAEVRFGYWTQIAPLSKD
jgi:hypothetical protein